MFPTTITTSVKETAPTVKGTGNAGGDDLQPPHNRRDEGDNSQRQVVPEIYRVGAWFTLIVAGATFATLTAVYIALVVLAQTRQPLFMPRALWASTLMIAASSVTFELARRNLKLGAVRNYRYWLWFTLAFGLTFLGAQLIAWRELVAKGIYLSSNPHGAFFYLLTGAHALHLLGGIGGLLFLLRRRRWKSRSAAEADRLRASLMNAVALYWHFMDGLWVYLFVLLFVWK